MAGPEHEKLQVYHRAAAVAVRAESYARRIPATRADLRDQLRRASASIALNIAEGANEFAPAEKAKFYRFARRSAGECMAVIDIAHGIGADPESAPLKSELSDINAMLTGLIDR